MNTSCRPCVWPNVLIAACPLLAALVFALTPARGAILVSDEFGNAVYKFNQNTGALLGTFTTSNLSGPDGMVVLGNSVLVANQSGGGDGLGSITKYDATTGAFQGTFASNATPGANLVAAAGLALHNNTVYVTSFGPNQAGSTSSVDGFDSSGNSLGRFSQASLTSNPSEIGAAVFGPDGNLYASSFGTNQIFQYNGTTGAFQEVFGTGTPVGKIGGPTGLAIGPGTVSGTTDLYVANVFNANIVRYNLATGAYDGFFNTGANTFPTSLMMLDGKLLVGESPAPSSPNGVYVYDPATGTALNGGAIFATAPGLQVPGFMLVVPEPSSLFLAGLGVAAVLFFRRRFTGGRK